MEQQPAPAALTPAPGPAPAPAEAPVKPTVIDLKPDQSIGLQQAGEAMVNIRLTIADMRDKIGQHEKELDGVKAHLQGAIAMLKATYKLEGDWLPTPDFKQLMKRKEN